MKINFYLNGRAKEKNIHIVILEKGKRKYFGLNLKIDKKFWDGKKQCAKSQYKSFEKLNKLLSNYRNNVTDLYYELRNRDFNLTAEYLFSEVKNLLFSKEIEFFEIWDEYIHAKTLEGKDTTIEKTKQLKQLLQDYQLYYDTEVTFNSIDMKFFDNLNAYMVEEKKYGANTMKKKISFLKSFMNWAKSRNYHNNELYKEFKVDGYQTVPNPLTYDEFMALVNLDLSQNLKLKKVRDLFVFACLSGQRISDFKKISKEALVKVNDSGQYTFGDIQYEWHLVSKK